MTADDRPLVILQPAPQRPERIFRPAVRAELDRLFRVVDLSDDQDPASFDRALPEAFAVIGQPDLPTERLAEATALRAICNVEGNFFGNVDYPTAFARGIHVLGCGPAYAQAVAEHALGLALDVARGISREDRAFRSGTERYVADGNADAVLLRGARVGLIGYGNLGRALRPLLEAFAVDLQVHDPWLPDRALAEVGLVAAPLPELLRRSQFVFVLATVTSDSEHLLGADQLAALPDGTRLILVSRAAVVDYDALWSELDAGRILAGVDVWPEEPVPADDPYRRLEGLVFSGHRAGGIPQAFERIGEMVVDDLRQIAAGLPPVRMQVAARELVGRYRNRPVG
ncbi:hydroxyacid dehydrogenase [Microlunatus aurantiacus]|uniref:Hydroxyacid dehydrogenase n=1 Tax=Microlunatus aurantiacus TaxID=446786 RepID=A0ABP7E783_9ACTN